jgi:hypothetical protein
MLMSRLATPACQLRGAQPGLRERRRRRGAEHGGAAWHLRASFCCRRVSASLRVSGPLLPVGASRHISCSAAPAEQARGGSGAAGRVGGWGRRATPR